MTFEVSADAYDRFMGQYSGPLADQFVDVAALEPGQRALDVGSGPGALTARLVDRLGASGVLAIDPSAPFVEALAERFPEVAVQQAPAEQLPFPDDHVDAALAQLVVQFMTNPVAGLREMARVTRPGGVVAACLWDHGGGKGPLSLFWQAAQDLDPRTDGERGFAGTHAGQLAQLFSAAGLDDPESSVLTVHRSFASFGDWWEPYTFGVGPVGAYVSRLDDEHLSALRAHCEELLPTAPFELAASAWCVRARA
jgi:SAM-dependent methyltransferase